MRRDPLRILVSGMIAGDPHQGGATWALLQYALGLRELGHDVWIVEPVPELTPSVVAYFDAVVAEFGLRDRCALLVPASRRTTGVPYQRLRAAAADADLLLNVSGMLTDEDLMSAVPVRVYLDLDPAFNQLWHAAEGIDMRFDGHTHFLTVGLGLGTAGCSVPLCGRRWIPTLPPVVLERWPDAGPAGGGAITTVGNWRGYGSIEHGGELLGQRAHSLRAIIDLPSRTHERLLLALAIHAGERRDLQALAEHGWELIDPVQAAGTPARYARFIRGSKAELGIAKSGYVVSRSGWFSDRSACYLASGRPVVAQDTGFSRFLPTGKGLLAFSTADDAAGALDAVAGDYAAHRRAARALAEDHFDSRRVLGRLLGSVGARGGHDC